MSNFYDNADLVTYQLSAASLTSAAVIGRFTGPAGKQGRVAAVTGILTTGVTVAASTLTIGPTGGTATANLDSSVAIAAINTGFSVTNAQIKVGAVIAKDVVSEVATDGGATAGAADIYVTIAWF